MKAAKRPDTIGLGSRHSRYFNRSLGSITPPSPTSLEKSAGADGPSRVGLASEFYRQASAPQQQGCQEPANLRCKAGCEQEVAHDRCGQFAPPPLGPFLLVSSAWKLFSPPALTVPDQRDWGGSTSQRESWVLPGAAGEHSSLQERPILGMFLGACRE